MLDAKANILIVDDRPDKLMSLEAVLHELGENIVTATSGREALRHVLANDFAVILLDVNMPGMDGLETASLIRQRKRSEHTPIIFVTSFGDEMHATRGYQLNAVDYILAPVMPEVLRTKVAVFVDLFKKAEQIRRQADSLHRRAVQLQKLAAASLAINAAMSMEKTLQSITDAARDIVGAHQAITLYTIDGSVQRPGATGPTQTLISFSNKYAHWATEPLDLDQCAETQLARSLQPVRLTHDALQNHVDWPCVSKLRLPPIRGVLACPLLGRDGRRMGLIYLTDKLDSAEFSEDDEAILVQLSQMASVAIENIIFSKEREANRIKDEFLATLGHELRTPLNAILGWTQILQMESLPEETAHAVEVIHRNAKSQAKLIEDLLDVSRVTSGKLELKLQPADMCTIVAGVVDTQRPNADAKRITLDFTSASAPAIVKGDPDRLQQVVWNLLTNAVKFTPHGGKIAVCLAVEADAVQLTVLDSGVGIAPHFLPFVFDRFRQADSTSTRSFGGLGIGLAIVRNLIELHGGTVVASSPGLGHGAAFSVSLPVFREKQAGSGVNGTAHAAAFASVASDSMELTDVSVLVVDDELDARDVVAEILRRAGAKVVMAASVAEAMKTLNQWQPTVLLSDIAMPDADGFSLIDQIRNHPDAEISSMAAIALTANARAEDRARALAAGFNLHVVKPVEAMAVVAAVAKLAASKSKAEASQNVALPAAGWQAQPSDVPVAVK